MLGILLAAAAGGAVIYCFGIRGIFVAAAVLMLALLPLLACLARIRRQDVSPRQEAADSPLREKCVRILEPSNRS
jgi:MFS family permease